MLTEAKDVLNTEGEKPKRKRKPKQEAHNGPEDSGEVISQWYDFEQDRAEAFGESTAEWMESGQGDPDTYTVWYRRRD
jgi:hypothetical protein